MTAYLRCQGLEDFNMYEDFKIVSVMLSPDRLMPGPGNEDGHLDPHPHEEPHGQHDSNLDPHGPVTPPGPNNPPAPPHDPVGPGPIGPEKPEPLVELNVNTVRYEFKKGTRFTHSQLVVLAYKAVDPNKTYTVTYWTVGQPSRTLDVSQVLILERRTFVNVACTHKS